MARQQQPRADTDRQGLGVAVAVAVCTAAGVEGAWGSPGPEGGRRVGACPLREVGREDERGAGEARVPPLQRPGRHGGEATEKGGLRWRRSCGGGCWEWRSRG